MKHPMGEAVVACILTLCVIGLPLAFGVIEYNTQRMATGRFEPGVYFAVEAGRPMLCTPTGETEAVPSAWRRGIYALLPAPLRALSWLWRGELEGAAWLWETQAAH